MVDEKEILVISGQTKIYIGQHRDRIKRLDNELLEILVYSILDRCRENNKEETP